MHNLPIGSFSRSVAKAVASIVGEVVESELGDGESEGCNFIKVRVAVKLSEPLCQGRQIVRSGGMESWVDFKYERLPNLCYWCERLIHHDKDCLTQLKKRRANRDEEKHFGSWLRVNIPNPSRRIAIRFAGFDDDLDEQGSDTEALTRGSAGKEGDDDEFAPNIVSNLPLVVSGIGLEPAEV